MTHASIAFCDLCGKPYEIGSQIHGAEIRSTAFHKNCKLYDEMFSMCLVCFEKSGLIEIFKQLAKTKQKNEKIVERMGKTYLQNPDVKKLLELRRGEDEEEKD